ncbi:MAG: cell division protein SepF [Lysinibacillus sp.]
MKELFKKIFYLEEEELAEQQEQQQPKQQMYQQQQAAQLAAVPTRAKKERKVGKQDMVSTNNVVSIHTATTNTGAKVVLAEPRVYAEAQDIAENLKNKRATIVNLQRIDRESGIRIIDFLSGTVYALGGDIQRIGTDIFLCTPENVEVSGEISDYLIDES